MDSPSTPISNFTYPRLSRDQVRLARVRKRPERQEKIEVQLVIVDWPPFDIALSYVWGDPAVRDNICVSANGSPPRPYSVTHNLYEALYNLSHKDRDRVLWIDALCIDQDNVQEKEQQVRIMDRIYQGAHNVCVWLGPGLPGSDTAMVVVPKLLLTIDGSFQSSRLRHGWALFARLLQETWFSRRWVNQEIALAKKATVHCGTREVSWLDFSDAISLYGSQKTVHLSGQTESPGVRELGAWNLSFLSSNALRKDRQGNILERRWSVEDLLVLLPMFQAQVPHDAVFAILSVASDGSEFKHIEYSQPPAELFAHVFKQIATKSRCLDMMFRPWAPEIPGNARLPTFVAPASRHSHIRGRDGRYERRNADSLVGLPRRPIYAETSPLAEPPVLELSMPQLLKSVSGRIGRPTLAARGVVCAVISELGGVCEDGVIPWDWLETWRDRQGHGEMEDLWRVVVAGRSHDGNAPPNWYRRAFKDCLGFKDSVSHGLDLDLSFLMEFRYEPGPYTDYIGRVSACVWGRRLLVSTRERPGYYGLVPAETALGDVLCLLEGCSVPVVFRGKPMTKAVLQALQLALPHPGAGLTARDEEMTVLQIQKAMSRVLAGRTGSSLKTLRPSSPGTLGNKSRQLLTHSLPDALGAALKESVAVALSRLSEEAEREMLQSALDAFFHALLREVLSAERPGDLPAAPGQDFSSWTNAAVRELFLPLFAKSCERAFEQVLRREIEKVLRPQQVVLEAGFYKPKEPHPRESRFDAATEKAWTAAWEQAWTGLKPLAAKLWDGELEIRVGEKLLQDELEYYVSEHLGDRNAYNVEIVGECYVEGLMDGEWWSAGETRTQPKRLFIIQ